MSAKDRTPRLGRGLAALLGDVARPDPATEHQIRILPLAQLRPSPFQPRRQIAQEALDSLAESIRASGLLQPILVRPEPDEADAWQIIAGERRWRAAQMAGLHEAPCLIRRFADVEAMAAGLVENLQRQDLDAIEEAEGYQRLVREFDLRQEDVAEAIGRSRAHVANTLRLLNLPASVQAELRLGGITAGHARALLAHPDPERAALQVIARGLNVRQTEALAQSASAPRPANGTAGTRASRDPDVAALEQELATRLGLRVNLRSQSGGRGQLRIDYADLDQLDGVLRLLMAP